MDDGYADCICGFVGDGTVIRLLLMVAVLLGTVADAQTYRGSPRPIRSGISYALTAASVTPTTFTDNFDRPDEALDANANWVTINGTTGSWAIVGQKVNTVKATPAIIAAPDTGTTDHFAEYVVGVGSTLSENGFTIGCRATASGDYVGVRQRGASGYQVFQSLGGVLTQLGSAVGTVNIGDTVRVTVQGTTVFLFVNNIQLLAQTTGATAGTRCGMVARAAIEAMQIDNWRSGAGIS